jgi:transposase
MVALKLALSSGERRRIKELLKYEEARVIRRANILNALHLGYTSGQIAELLQVDPKTVTNVGHAYAEGGMESALFDEERSGRPIDFDDRERSRIVAMVCSDPPTGNYRWSLDLIAQEADRRGLIDTSISREQVRIILQEHGLKPWQEKMWCIGALTPEYIERMEDVLNVYERPYNAAIPVVCLDEKPVALLADTRERIAAQPGSVMKKDYEYRRNGSVNVFCAVEPKVGRYFNRVTPTRCGGEFAQCLAYLTKSYPDAKKIALVMDNLSTHSQKQLLAHYGDVEGARLWNRFEIHYTPKHGSWLNQAEIAIGMYARQCLGDGRIGSLANLKLQTKAWNKQINRKSVKIQWRFNTIKARKSFGYAPHSHPEKLI